MSEHDDLWAPLVDEPIGPIIEQLQAEHPEIGERVTGPQAILAFRTFAHIRVGLVLGQLLVESDVPDYDGTGPGSMRFSAIRATGRPWSASCARWPTRSPRTRATGSRSRSDRTKRRASGSASSPADSSVEATA